jgi:hypothetical protein
MTRNVIFWVLAFIITVFSAIYQRTTGPTYPVSGQVVFQGKTYDYKFLRSHSVTSNSPVILPTYDTNIKVSIHWREHNSDKEIQRTPMTLYYDTVITGELSEEFQKGRYFYYADIPLKEYIAVHYLKNEIPFAAKIDYFLQIESANEVKSIPEDNPVVIRFKGDVPFIILILHIIVIFASMLVAMRTGLEFFNKEPQYKKYLLWTIGLLILGGFVLGPIMQKYAFGEYWTGFPFGIDLTDNKALIAFIGWVAAFIAQYKSKKPGVWVLGAALLMLVVYLIPHSVLGSELDYSKMR